jgi:PITH domain
VFANPIGLDCESAASQPATQVLELKPADVEKVQLRYVLFSKVSALALFFPANFDGDDQTVVQRLAVFGAQVPNVRCIPDGGSACQRLCLETPEKTLTSELDCRRKELLGQKTQTSRTRGARETGLERHDSCISCMQALCAVIPDKPWDARRRVAWRLKDEVERTVWSTLVSPSC